VECTPNILCVNESGYHEVHTVLIASTDTPDPTSGETPFCLDGATATNQNACTEVQSKAFGGDTPDYSTVARYGDCATGKFFADDGENQSQGWRDSYAGTLDMVHSC
jgi:hypothetical protein